MGSVEEQFQTVARSNLSESINVAGVSPNVHANDTRCPPRDRLLYFQRIEGVRPRIDIAKNRRDPLPLESVSRRDKSEGWNDDFTFHSQGFNRDLQGHRAIAHGNTMLHANQVSNALLELFYDRAIVGEPARVENLVETFKQARAVADVRPIDVELLVKGRHAAENRQVVNSLFHQVLAKH